MNGKIIDFLAEKDKKSPLGLKDDMHMDLVIEIIEKRHKEKSRRKKS